jgi:hypothetical protein
VFLFGTADMCIWSLYLFNVWGSACEVGTIMLPAWLYCIHGSVLIGSLSSDLGTIQVCILITHHW